MSAARNICIVTQRYGPQVNGGAELLLRQLAQKLAALDGVRVTVVTTCAEDYLSWNDVYPAGEQQDGPVRVLRFAVDLPRDVEKFLAINTKFTNGPLTKEEQARWVWEQGPVCLDLIAWLREHKAEYDAFLLGPYLYFLTVHGLPEVAEKSILIPMAHDEGPIHMPIYKDVFESARALCYLTPDEKELVQRLFPGVSRLDMIGGAGVEVPARVDGASFRQKYRIPGPYAVYVGRIEVGKCCDEMFRQWDAYQRHCGGGATLVLMGKAIMPVPRRPDVRELGFVSEEDKFSGIAGADFLWLPSRFESLSIVVLEALCLGMPVLVNGGCSVLKSHCLKSGAGLWYETDGQCLTALRRLFADAPLRAALGAAGPAYVKEYYRWDTILARLCALIDTVAQGPAKEG